MDSDVQDLLAAQNYHAAAGPGADAPAQPWWVSDALAPAAHGFGSTVGERLQEVAKSDAGEKVFDSVALFYDKFFFCCCTYTEK